ncbi:MAG: methylated-DNA--[protein]-cysteine S-methyltransferase [Desulfobacterales bacterium]|nr:methylated-DNA--[protein]-cysteine S-methyltransferase [Desulfobacterales bacterium]
MPVFSVYTGMGAVHVAVRTDPFSLKRIFLPGRLQGPEQYGVAGKIETAMADFDFQKCRQAVAVAQLIHDYFKFCRSIATPWQWLDMQRLTPLQQQVLRLTAEIPCGQVRSYRDIAVKLRKPGAARFVGNTLAANPWPLLIACHRVVRSNGETGGFGGGSLMKKKLLAHEAGTKDPELAH